MMKSVREQWVHQNHFDSVEYILKITHTWKLIEFM